MAQDKPNTPLEGLVLGIVGVGSDSGLGWNLGCYLSASIDKLTRKGVFGPKGISKVLIYNRNTDRAEELVEQMNNNTMRGSKSKVNFDYATAPSEIAKKTDICIFLYDTIPGDIRRSFKAAERNKSFGTNLDALIKDYKAAFDGYKGMVVFGTNPSDYMTYFGTQILGLSKNQCVGFNHVDTFRFRLELKRVLKSTCKSGKLRKLIDQYAYIIGTHNKKSVGLFSNIKERGTDKGEFWNSEARRSMHNKEIMEYVHERAFELIKKIGSPNDNCVNALTQVIKGIVTCKGTYEMSYHIKIPQSLRKELQEKYNIDLEGVCLGVPVEFYQDAEGRRRARINEEYLGNDSHELKLEGLFPGSEYNEIVAWQDCLRTTAVKTIEAILLKNKEQRYRFLEETDTNVIKAVYHNELLVTEKKNKTKRISIKEKSRRGFIKPDIACFATYKNKLAVVTMGVKRLLHAYEFPNVQLEDLVKGTACEAIAQADSAAEITGKDAQINFMSLNDDKVYFTEDYAVERKKINWGRAGNSICVSFRDEPVCRYELKENAEILSFLEQNNIIFCGLSNGSIIELDSNLKEIKKYKTGNDASIKKIKQIKFKKKTFLFAMNDAGEIYKFTDNLKGEKINDSKKYDFDVMLEKSKDEELLCMYAVNEARDIEQAYYSDDIFTISKTIDQKFGKNLKEIFLTESGEIYLISKAGVKIRDTEGNTQDISLNEFEDKILDKLLVVKQRV